MIAMTGRVTMLGLSQWAGKGGKGKCIALAGIIIGTLFFLLNVYTILAFSSLDW